MSESIHPSIDHLNAFFDQELDASHRNRIEDHLRACADCQGTLADFATLQEMGPAIEQRLPGDAFWLDLPDRIQARIASTPLRRTSPSWIDRWSEVFRPRSAWRYALGSAVASAVLASAWVAFHEPENPVTPVANLAATDDELGILSPLTQPDQDLAGLTPETFTRRVIHTLGGNPGTSLDLVPGEPIDDTPDQNPLGSSVGLSLGPEARQEAERVMNFGCGEISGLESAFLAALKAEEEGNHALAGEGYRLIRQQTDPANPLHWEARYRYIYNAWRQKLTTIPAPTRAQAIDRLQVEAVRSYQQWTRSQLPKDCREAYCINRAVAKLLGEESGRAPQPTAASNMNVLANCAN